MCKWILWAALCVPTIAAAQGRSPISTDRPGFSDGSFVVPDRVWQIETGFFRTYVGGQPTTSVGDLVLRRGLGSRAELRILGLTYGYAPGNLTGFLDPSIGFKFRLQEATGKRGEITFIGSSTFPVGASPLRANIWNLTAKIAWSTPIGADTLGGNFAIAQQGAGAQRFAQGAVSLTYSHSLSAPTSLTAEAWVVDHVGRGLGTGSYCSLAVTQLLNLNTQLDLRLGTGLNQGRDGWFLQGGVSFRF